MSPDPHSLAQRITVETGLEFEGRKGRDSDGTHWVELRPAGHAVHQTFVLRITIGWRHINIMFRPGSFAGDLVRAMGNADEAGRTVFRSVLSACHNEGAEVTLTVNGSPCDFADCEIWNGSWRIIGLTLRKGMLAINEGNNAEDLRQIELWSSRAAAAVIAILPLEAEGDDSTIEITADAVGRAEGAKARIDVNRYERDRRNRAAALAIHGYRCKACDLDMSDRYGPIAAGLIEVHHTTPVSQLGADYIIDPNVDLMPLCPNCHSVTHRRSPSFSIAELRTMLSQT
ncbi:HNH endonuclease [Acetobacter cerevisiae]|uniref:HNH endonuclease n=1 Tax=Acetobacter cerevisiae TaxID=178900 RepID=A0A149UWX6_9PROT|nr:HNH endonuclease [Acetobacter cerevisiae]KXV72253.1 HNH endonuclease [Acetobacter cerevisiae]